MLNPESIRKQVESLTADLIGVSLCSDQQYPKLKRNKNLVEVNFGQVDLSIVLKNRPYLEIYNELERNRFYNIKMLDGAIIHLMYRFKDGVLESHRLAFFPSPNLEEFQNNPDIYELDEIYADIIMKNIVPFPIRFDFDIRDGVVKVLEHPASHLTLGQYKNCRIPVSGPLTPYCFIHFILINFYNTAYKKFSNKLTKFKEAFNESIHDLEKNICHLKIPC